jgi:hypothetical protein
MNIWMRLCLFLVLALLSRLSSADDTYNNYVGDIYLNESYQARIPNVAIRYTDGEYGALLKSILNPRKASAMLGLYFQGAKKGEGDPNLPQALAPLLKRYDKAFNEQPRLYEAEYLDTLEMAGVLTVMTTNMLNEGVNLNAQIKNGVAPTEEQIKFVNGLQALSQSLASISSTMGQKYAETIKKRVDAGLFSPDGAQRALKITVMFNPKQSGAK